MRLHIVHTNPELLELAKEGDGGEPRTRISEERKNLEVALARSANVVAGVGPMLSGWIADDLGAIDAEPRVIQIDPGLRDWGVSRDPNVVPSQREFLLVGRVEDFESKGVELAIRALGQAVSVRPALAEVVHLVLRGVPLEHHVLRERVNAIANEYGINVIFRLYSENIDDVKTDIRKAIAVLMPSPHEGFGLAAYEAIALGTPVVISTESGLAQMLKGMKADGRVSVAAPSTSGKGVNPVAKWASLIGAVLDDPKVSLREAAVLRDELQALDLWGASMEQLLSALENARTQQQSEVQQH